MPRGLFLLLLLAVPVVEIFLLVQLGRAVGGGITFALIVGTAVAGITLLRRARGSIASDLSQAMSAMGARSSGMAEIGMRMAAGALLLIPGVVTDALGLVLALPFLRKPLAGVVGARMEKRFQAHLNQLRTQGMGAIGGMGGFTWPPGAGGAPGSGAPPAVGDAEVIIDIEAEPPTNGPYAS